MTLEEIFKIIDKCKESNINSFEADGFKIAFFFGRGMENISSPAHSAAAKELKDHEAKITSELSLTDLLNPLDPFADLSEEEIKYAATPYFDELQAKKADHQAKLDGENK